MNDLTFLGLGYIGAGIGAGTYTWWKIFGLGLCILSVLWLFNMLPAGGL